VLGHATTGVTPGSYAKVTVDVRGHVTAGTSLQAADIPNLDASKINAGTLDIARLANGSVTAQKLADYALAYIQEAVPPAGVNSHPIGMIWLQESTGQVSVWNGNSWMKTGASTLFNKNLRYAGSYNPTTGLVTGVTQFGTAEGFKVGDTIPAADDKIAGLYFVASGAGSNASVAGGLTFDAGDWLLCHGTTGGWVRIDTLNGASGGGGGGSSVSNLDDLLDVTLTAPSQGDILQMGASGQWINVSTLDEGTWT
jgi:phage-related tail fiber protein